ncbi:TPA: hypothetical protein DCX16_06010 [bacterium]|nr:hypothetical protein [bacterium]
MNKSLAVDDFWINEFLMKNEHHLWKLKGCLDPLCEKLCKLLETEEFPVTYSQDWLDLKSMTRPKYPKQTIAKFIYKILGHFKDVSGIEMRKKMIRKYPYGVIMRIALTNEDKKVQEKIIDFIAGNPFYMIRAIKEDCFSPTYQEPRRYKIKDAFYWKNKRFGVFILDNAPWETVIAFPSENEVLNLPLDQWTREDYIYGIEDFFWKGWFNTFGLFNPGNLGFRMIDDTGLEEILKKVLKILEKES